jgi:hypothetical protein
VQESGLRFRVGAGGGVGADAVGRGNAICDMVRDACRDAIGECESCASKSSSLSVLLSKLNDDELPDDAERNALSNTESTIVIRSVRVSNQLVCDR